MASKPKKRMGKGVDALFSEIEENIFGGASDEAAGSEKNEEKIRNIKIHDIEPNKNQPRKSFDKEKLDVLAESIKQHGVVQPIIVKENISGTYTIVAGERRWRASKTAGLKEIPCIVRELDSQSVMEIALIENLQRENLNPIEEAEGYQALIESFDMTQEAVAERVGKSRSAVANSLRLNNLTPDVKKLVAEEKLSGGHARTLLAIADPKTQNEAANEIIKNGLSVRQTEALVKSYTDPKPKKPRTRISGMMKKYYKDIENDLASRLGTKVNITEGANKGKIEIEYYSKDDFERILFELKK